ncbi:hypothetical protein ACWCO3_15295 [Micromonospora sp. NPDC002411]
MTSSAQPERQVEVDLTVLDSAPSEGVERRGVDAYTDVSHAPKILGAALRIRDMSSELTDAVRVLLISTSIAIPATLVAVVCIVTGAPMVITLLATITTLILFATVSILLLQTRRRHIALDDRELAKPNAARPAAKPENRVND